VREASTAAAVKNVQDGVLVPLFWHLICCSTVSALQAAARWRRRGQFGGALSAKGLMCIWLRSLLASVQFLVTVTSEVQLRGFDRFASWNGWMIVLSNH
jgi:hypothetical protein